MEKSTRKAIISSVISGVCTLIAGCIGTNMYYSSSQTQLHNENHNLQQEIEQLRQDQDQKQQQNQVVIINGNEVPIREETIEDFSDQISKLENQNKEYSNIVAEKEKEIETLNSDIADLKAQIEDLPKRVDEETDISEINNVEKPESEENLTYLDELSVFSCKRCSYGTWYPSNIAEWNKYDDKTSDGKTHERAVSMTIREKSGTTQQYFIDYLLESEYKILNGNFALNEPSNSTASVATLKIYGKSSNDDDGRLLYEYNNITGGFIPQNTGNISIEGVVKLRFEFTSEVGDIGNCSADFGVVFYDTYLK